MRVLATVLTLVAVVACAQGQSWVAPMIAVRTNYNDTNGSAQGAISRFGDSITVSKAYFAPLHYGYSNTTPESADALTWIHSWNTAASWTWQDDPSYDQHGAQGSMTTAWPLTSAAGWPGALGGETKVGYWLRNDNPEIAVIMFGTNDLSAGLTPAQVQANLRAVVQACKTNGTIPILSTIPPRSGYDNGTVANQQRAADFDTAIKAAATAEQVPLLDYRGEILTRHPNNPPIDTWDGSNAMWNAYGGYEVPTSISRDGVHPSNYSTGQSNFSDAGLDSNGFNLRNYMTLMSSFEVYEKVIVPEPATIGLLVLGGLALIRRRGK